MNDVTVISIDKSAATEWIVKKHYSQTMPSVMYCYGVFIEKILRGVCTYSLPNRQLSDSANIIGRSGVNVLELNRLCVDDGLEKNTLSKFVAATFRLLPRPTILVSYADGSVGHVGYIYQATNWIYTGISTSKHFIGPNGERVHRRTVSSMSAGGSIKDGLPEGIQPGEVESKHRYIMILGSRGQVKKITSDMISAGRYTPQPYPKGETKRHNTDVTANKQMLMF